MHKFTNILGALSIALSPACYAAEDLMPMQSKASYEAAFSEISTAPSYVLVTVVDANTGLSHTGCTDVNFLRGAIHKEYDIANDAEGSVKADQIALANTSHAFRLTNPAALANVAFQFSADDLGLMRDKLRGLTEAELRDGFSTSGKLHALYDVWPLAKHRAYRDAIACALIERGLSPRKGDISDRIWLAK